MTNSIMSWVVVSLFLQCESFQMNTPRPVDENSSLTPRFIQMPHAGVESLTCAQVMERYRHMLSQCPFGTPVRATHSIFAPLQDESPSRSPARTRHSIFAPLQDEKDLSLARAAGLNPVGSGHYPLGSSSVAEFSLGSGLDISPSPPPRRRLLR